MRYFWVNITFFSIALLSLNNMSHLAYAKTESGGDFKSSLRVSASGMRAQQKRMEIISQNIANADSTAETPEGKPYQRKYMTFKNEYDKKMGVNLVEPGKIAEDNSEFKLRFQPNHPAADENGYVAYPNVNTMVEVMDSREARQSFEANLQAIEVTKSMMNSAIKVLE